VIHTAVTKADKRCSTNYKVEHLHALCTAFQSGQPARQRLSGPIPLTPGQLYLAVNQGCKNLDFKKKLKVFLGY